jgi:cytidylate kinase
VEERAKRRYLQFRGKGIDITMNEAKMNIIERDKRDASRDIAPLRVAAEALLIDSSSLSVEQVKNNIIDCARTDP